MKAASWLGPAVAGLVQRVGYVRKGCCQLGTKTRSTEMPAAIRPYSMAVAPDSSFKNLVIAVML